MGDAITSYINTLIFVIIAKAVTLILLVALLNPTCWKFSYLIITIETGLVAIIAWTLYRIYKIQEAIDEAAKAAATAPAMLDRCPDYFVRSVDASTKDQVCNNTYKTPDGKTTYTFTKTDGTTAISTQNLTTMATGVKTMNNLCTSQQAGGSNANPIDAFSWTDLKARCGWMDSYV